MNWITKLVADGTSEPSTMRIAVLLIIGAVLAQWLYLTFHTGTAQKLDWEQVGLILGTLGAKAAQSKIETPKPTT